VLGERHEPVAAIFRRAHGLLGRSQNRRVAFDLLAGAFEIGLKIKTWTCGSRSECLDLLVQPNPPSTTGGDSPQSAYARPWPALPISQIMYINQKFT